MTTVEPTIPLGARRNDPFVFRRFFEMGLEESASPFLNERARQISRNLPLKASLFAAILLAIAFSVTTTAISEVLLVTVYLIAGAGPLIDSIEDICFRRDVNIDVLMTIAAFSAYFLGAGFEGALLLVLFAISGSLEELVTLKAKNALSLIHSLAPTKAYIVDSDNHLIERAVEDVAVGATILVRAGEIIPLDGIVVAGASSLDFAHLTGESRPIRKKVGDEVPSGARVMEGSLTIQVVHTSSDSTVARIIQLITKAQAAKPRLERWFDRFGRRYAITIICAFFGFTLFFAYGLGLPYFAREGAIYRALAFLITASPCALILAVPIAYLSTLGALAKRGIVLKGGVVLDALNECSIIAFDKTGTLTLGELIFDSVESYGKEPFSREQAIGIAASLERNAVHPIAKAIVHVAEEADSGISLFPVNGVHVVPGYGVEGVIDLDSVAVNAFVGDVKAVVERVPPRVAEELLVAAKQKQLQGKIVAVLIVKECCYLFGFQDHPRKDVTTMLANVEKSGRRLLMLTGDSKENAAQIAKLVGIREYYAELTPEDKLEKISALSATYGLVMVGDGINDAPALARASVGICMGKIGSATAQQAADCVLLNDNIELLDWLLHKASATRTIVRQNLTIAISAIIFASIPALFGVVPLWLAVILHEGGTVLVGLNAIRLLKR